MRWKLSRSSLIKDLIFMPIFRSFGTPSTWVSWKNGQPCASARTSSVVCLAIWEAFNSMAVPTTPPVGSYVACASANGASLVRLGYGRFQKRIEATVTSETRQIAVDLASDKEETNRTLHDAGLPVPRQRKVYNASDAVDSAERIGYPVVIKPLDSNHGQGVSVKLTTPDQVKLAFEGAQEYSKGVLVERYIPGSDYRMLVVDHQLLAVARRIPAHVVGDGVHTVEALVEEVNKDPHRGVGHENVLTRVGLDGVAERLLGHDGYSPETLPEPGETVYLSATANLSSSGPAIDD